VRRPLVLRDDDKEETIRRRLGEFHKNTDALLDHYRRQGLVRDVDATRSLDQIFADILTGLGNPPAFVPTATEGRAS
jgi:adenylate kinase